jgi:SNF2 family DNA or RNA helicase
MLDLIAIALCEKGVDFCRIDGRSTLSQRGKALDRFGKNPACTIMLASMGAAGEGYVLIFSFF